MKERKLPVILISLIFSFVVWVSINLANPFQTTIEVPVRIENLRPQQAIAVPLPSTVRIKIQGTGWQLLNTLLTPNLYYTVDFSTLSTKDILFTSRELNERVNLSSSIHVFETDPETVVVRLDERISKKVPVSPAVAITYREGFGIVGKIGTAPDSIVLIGARSLLSAIHEWKTVPIVLKDINAPVNMKLALVDSLKFEIVRPVSSIAVSFDVQPIAEKTIHDIAVEIVQVPEKRNVVLIPPKISIIVRSGVNNVANLSSGDFQAFIDYKSILLDTSGYLKANIVGPQHVQIVQQQPEKIQYVVRK